jgi:hypothetical protein
LAELINLNRARKARARAEKTATAAANRVVHGLTRAERVAAEAERARASRLLDGVKRDAPQDD